jgi:hypothetical protein
MGCAKCAVLKKKLKWMAEKESDTAMGWQLCRAEVERLKYENATWRRGYQMLEFCFLQSKQRRTEMRGEVARLTQALSEIRSAANSIPGE